MLTKFFQKRVSLGKIFSICSFALKKVWDRVKPETVNSHSAPEVENIKNFLLNKWIAKVELGLMVKEMLPVILTRHWIPCPVWTFKILKNYSDIPVFGRIICPYIV